MLARVLLLRRVRHMRTLEVLPKLFPILRGVGMGFSFAAVRMAGRLGCELVEAEG